jgi:hypothetical protein
MIKLTVVRAWSREGLLKYKHFEYDKMFVYVGDVGRDSAKQMFLDLAKEMYRTRNAGTKTFEKVVIYEPGISDNGMLSDSYVNDISFHDEYDNTMETNPGEAR